MEFFRRIFFVQRVTVSQKEDLLIGNLSDISKKFIVRRKTILTVIAVITTISTILSIVDVINMYTSLNIEDPIITGKSINYLLMLDIFSLLIVLLKSGFLWLARYNWNNYKKSSTCILISGFFCLYIQLLELFIPLRKIITLNDDSNFADNFSLFYSIANILLNKIVYYFPSIFLIQSIIGRTNVLMMIFTDSCIFMILYKTLVAIYIPLYTIIIGLIFQLTVDVLLFFIWLLYTIQLLLPLIAMQWKTMIETLISIILLILSYILLDTYNYNLIQILIQSFFGYLFISVVLSDYIIRVIMNHRLNNEKTTLIETFIEDINQLPIISGREHMISNANDQPLSDAII